MLDKLREIIQLTEECERSNQEDLIDISRVLKKPSGAIPRMGKQFQGKFNSVYSAAEGIIHNIEDGTQDHLSNYTCNIIEKTFTKMKETFPEWEEVKFVETDVLPKVIPPAPTPTIPTNTTLSDLFDLSKFEATVTFRKVK